jgi:hypothetical protein
MNGSNYIKRGNSEISQLRELQIPGSPGQDYSALRNEIASLSYKSRQAKRLQVPPG